MTSGENAELQHRDAGFLSPRAVIIGSVLCVVCGVAGSYWTVYLQSSRMFADYHTAGASFFLFWLLVIFTLGLGRLWAPLRLRTDELMAVGAMMLVGGSIVSSGLVAYLIPSLSAPYYFATPANQWHTLLWEHLPAGLSPLDPNGATVAITKFWEGLPTGEPIPWSPWVGPLLRWGVFLMAFFACMIAIMVIMRKQWVDYEHLSFPIAQVPAELCAVAERGRGNHIFHSTAFWLGLGFTLFVTVISGLAYYLTGKQVFFRLRETVQFVEGGSWNLSVYIDLVVVGLVFLIPNRVAFTVWFMAFCAWFLNCFLTSYNLTLPDAGMYGGELRHAAGGATVVFVLSSLWLSRLHLKRVFRCAFGLGDRDYDAGEPTSYRMALLMVVGGAVFGIVWLRLAGLHWLYSAALVLLTLAVYYAMARVVAQCGLPALSPPMYANEVLASTVGTQNLGADQVSVMAMHYGWHFDIRNSPMSGAAHGMYLTRRRRRGLVWAMLLALVLAYAAATLTTVWVCYRHGGVNMDPYFFNTYPKYIPWNWAGQAAQNLKGPSFARMFWQGGGALLMGLLIVAQRSFFWWPIHPVGMLVVSSHMVRFFWFSVFLAWLVKAFIVKFGGYGAFRVARRFMIGMVMGFFLGGGSWAIIDTLFEKVGNAVFYI
ncbi:MAG: hypothetical protein PVJ27_00305 [Candidatus Brocadiaceae bacterium]|jgi:hypothetical protein